MKKKTVKEGGAAMKTRKGGSTTVAKDGKVTKTPRKKKAKPKPEDTTETKVNENVD